MARLRRRWTAEEDALLRRAVRTTTAQGRPLLWRDLAKYVPGRSNKDCRRRWWNSLADGTTKGPWCEEEDERLIEAVRKYGTNWSRVSRATRSRNPDQCSSHWSQVLDPAINYCDWSPEEDANLLHAVLTHSTNWATIAASHIPPRTRLALKNRYSTLRLRHENEIKKDQNIKGTVETSTSNFDAPMTAYNRNLGWNSQVRIHPTRTPDECDLSVVSDEYEEDNKNKEDDQDEGTDRDGKVRDSSGSPCVKISTTLSGANAGVMDFQMQETGVAAPDGWVGSPARSSLFPLSSFHHRAQPMPIGNWTNETANPEQYESLFELTTWKSYLCGIEDPGIISTGLPYRSYGITSPTDISFSDPMSFHGSTQTATVDPSFTNNTARTEASPPSLGGATPFISQGNSATTTPRTSVSGWRDHPANYQVCINMTCNGEQMESVMDGLAGLGTDITMKIDVQENRASLETQL
ncbi:hypothetical protein F5Y06DRAFT_299307 [Hypoxylon sp. FL0890]|nr:hypothetical protein F5Y06DRAFT_299307 [Hypoxylon sp. FL0890]